MSSLKRYGCPLASSEVLFPEPSQMLKPVDNQFCRFGHTKPQKAMGALVWSCFEGLLRAQSPQPARDLVRPPGGQKSALLFGWKLEVPVFSPQNVTRAELQSPSKSPGPAKSQINRLDQYLKWVIHLGGCNTPWQDSSYLLSSFYTSFWNTISYLRVDS